MSAPPYAWNAVYIEAFGAGIFPTLNYELHAARQVSARVGFLWVPDPDDNVYIVPLMGFFLRGEGASRLELGAGTTLMFGGIEHGHHYIGSLAVGYRYHPDTRGEFFRIAWTPLFSLDEPRWRWRRNAG